MNTKQKFFICKHCGNMLGLIKNEGVPLICLKNEDVPLICCGEKMSELVPNTVEASLEKHIPVVEAAGSDAINVKIGSAPHPMEEEHHINFVYVETENGGQRKALKIGSDAVAAFAFKNDKPLAVYAYCNLHGLWKVEV